MTLLCEWAKSSAAGNLKGLNVKTYPINLVLQDRLVVLVGAKGEITHKIAGLLEANARIRVIAPSASPVVQRYAEAGKIEWLRRRYRRGDLAGAMLVFANTGDARVHDAVWEEGKSHNQLVNVMDVIPQCDFYGVSFMRRGLLTIAIGTGGAAPALAVTLRKRFEREFGEHYADFLDRSHALRPLIKQRIPPFRHRMRFWYALVESEAIALLAQGRVADYDALVEQLMTEHEAILHSETMRKAA